VTAVRLALAGALVGAAFAVAPASAFVCSDVIQPACAAIGYACRTLHDHPALGVECAPLN
jgi:hypothetical protein